LAEALMARAKARELPPAEIHFDYSEYDGKVSLIEPLIGRSGWLAGHLFSVESLDQAEDHLILVGATEDGNLLDDATARRLLGLPGRLNGAVSLTTMPTLEQQTKERQACIQRAIEERNVRFFEAEAAKLDGWADDLKVALEREIKELDRQIREARRAATAALTLDEKLAAQKQIKNLEVQRNQKRRSLFDAQDQVDKQREDLIAVIEGKMRQTTSLTSLFVLRWTLS
jgi:adenine-specific DNA-methyltransferase